MTIAAASGSGGFALKKLLGIAKGNTAAAGALLVLGAALIVWHLRPNRAGTEQTGPAQPPLPAVLAEKSHAQNDSALAISEPTNALASSQMALKVVDAESAQPIPNAKLYLNYLRQDGRGNAVRQVTDANGKLRVEGLKVPFRGLNLFVGYTYEAWWSVGQIGLSNAAFLIQGVALRGMFSF